ncbi:protein NRT1/ PTR FAMILY 6.2-like [Pyrus x bretschneideri]|uniref:protein NRT1/ PTR FAMILY 6.2-like n=1 Tax=Pyrus x bretschneideri TaxID=225117 RepID=UPI00202E26DD|nr:protein NRT1/ PTR FAMILY 6.2-like [Pyrus x bretschneideri]
MAIGLVLATFGMRAAQCARKRLAVAKANGGLNPLPIRVFFLLPQFLLVGYGNAFMPTGQLDFFITESPTGLKTMRTGLFLGTLSFGFFFSSLRVWIVNKVTGGKNGGWLAKTINQGRLDCFYGLLTILVVGEFETIYGNEVTQPFSTNLWLEVYTTIKEMEDARNSRTTAIKLVFNQTKI